MSKGVLMFFMAHPRLSRPWVLMDVAVAGQADRHQGQKIVTPQNPWPKIPEMNFFCLCTAALAAMICPSQDAAPNAVPQLAL
jgi:hypothetical protein